MPFLRFTTTVKGGEPLLLGKNYERLILLHAVSRQRRNRIRSILMLPRASIRPLYTPVTTAPRTMLRESGSEPFKLITIRTINPARSYRASSLTRVVNRYSKHIISAVLLSRLLICVTGKDQQAEGINDVDTPSAEIVLSQYLASGRADSVFVTTTSFDHDRGKCFRYKSNCGHKISPIHRFFRFSFFRSDC